VGTRCDGLALLINCHAGGIAVRSSQKKCLRTNNDARYLLWYGSYLLQTFAVHTACRVSQSLIRTYTLMRARHEGSPASSAQNSIAWNQTMHLSRYSAPLPTAVSELRYPNAGAMRQRRNRTITQIYISKGVSQEYIHLYYIHKHSFPLAVPAATQSSVGWNLATAGTAVMPSPPSCASCCPLAV
jgi:hypothetical protein